MHFSYLGVKNPQVIIDFCQSSHGRTRTPTDALLIDRDRRGEIFYLIHIRLSGGFEQVLRIGGKAFHIPPVPFGIDGIEGHGGFSRSGKTCDHDEFIARNIEIYVLEIVDAGSLDDYLVSQLLWGGFFFGHILNH